MKCFINSGVWSLVKGGGRMCPDTICSPGTSGINQKKHPPHTHPPFPWPPNSTWRSGLCFGEAEGRRVAPRGTPGCSDQALPQLPGAAVSPLVPPYTTQLGGSEVWARRPRAVGQRSCKPPLWLCRFGLQPKPKGAAGQGCAAPPPSHTRAASQRICPWELGKESDTERWHMKAKQLTWAPGGQGGAAS